MRRADQLVDDLGEPGPGLDLEPRTVQLGRLVSAADRIRPGAIRGRLGPVILRSSSAVLPGEGLRPPRRPAPASTHRRPPPARRRARPAPCRAGVERKLAHLAARVRRSPPSSGSSAAAGVGAMVEPGRAHLVVDQPSRSRSAVGIAGQRRGALGALSQTARSGAFRACRSPASITMRQSRRARRQRPRRRRRIAAAGLDPDRAAAAEQRHGVRLVDQARRIGGQRVALEPHQRERIVRHRRRAARSAFGRARAPGRRRARTRRTIGWAGSGRATNASIAARLEGDHETRRLRSPATKYEASRDVICSAIDLGGAVFGVALAARTGEALLLARNVVADARECRAVDHDLAGCKLDQRVASVDAGDLVLGPAGR